MRNDMVLHGSSNKKITERQLEANRRNALKGGVKSDEGKAVSRHNARKHGIFASALTERDAEDLAPILDDFMERMEPEGAIEESLVEKLAVTYLRMQRCARAEAEYHRAAWAVVPGRIGEMNAGSPFKPRYFHRLVELVNRYDVSLTNQYLRLLHELERLRRLRGGEKLPAPVAADVGIHGG